MRRDPADRYRAESAQVLYTRTDVTTVDSSDIGDLKAGVARQSQQRIRLCAHRAPNDPLHEMLIVLARGTYIRPHKHPGKSESTHVIEGVVDVVVFDDAGVPDRVIRMGDYRSGRTFYYRMAAPLYHTLLIRSDILVFHETTNGPFDRQDTVFAPWAPNGTGVELVTRYVADLEDRIRHTHAH